MTDEHVEQRQHEFSAPPVRSLLDLAEKVVIVTGGGSGVGRGVALRIAEAGARVVVHFHTSAAGAAGVVEAVVAAGGQATVHQADLSAPDAAAGLIASAVTAFGRVDALINNAGVYPLASVLDMTLEQWDTLMNANLRSVFLCTQAAARQMIAQASGGVIVNITSIEAENPALNHSHYNASKGGVLMYTRAAAGELGRHGIRVNAVAPGLIWKDDIEQTWPDGVARWRRAAPLGRLGMPEDVADACLFLVSPAARWITGASLTVDGGVMTHQIY
jgi:NAD(P)-dependent dehydrogenase (short-subunit alcohol dehydrogenase family)